MPAGGYISDPEEIVCACWLNFQQDGAAACKLSERSPLPPALTMKNIPAQPTQVLNVRWMKRINHHAAESKEDSAPGIISDTNNWLNWNGDLENTDMSEDNWQAGDESDVDLHNSIEVLAGPEQQDVSTAPNVTRLIRPIRMSKKQAEMGFATVTSMDMKRYNWNKHTQDRMGQYVFTRFNMLLDQEFDWEHYYWRIVSSCISILVDIQIYSRQNVKFSKIYKFE